MQVVVVGAGPAGCIAAETLALGGARTILIEKEIGRDKPCGGGIPSSVIDDFNIPAELLERTFNIVHFIGPSLIRVPMRFPDKMYMATVNRRKFDAHLLKRAQDAKAIIIAGRFIEFETGKRLKVRYKAEDGVVYTAFADFIIGADGAMSRVGFNAFGANLPHVAAMQEILKLDKAGRQHYHDRCEFYYASRISPDYYGWIFPRADTIALGVGTTYQHADKLEQCLAELKRINVCFLSGAELVKRSAAVIPRAMYSAPGKGNVLLCGDAAGFVLPGCGEGIFFAMESGRRAARAILDAPRKGYKNVLRVYGEGLKDDYGPIFDYFRRIEKLAFKDDGARETFVRVLRDRALGTHVLKVFASKAKDRRSIPWKIKTAFQLFILRRLAEHYIENGLDILGED
jgi:geranylgeranyl reductase